MKKDTIAAISTGMTNSGIGIVRMSGEESFQIIKKIYKGKENIELAKSHTIHYGFIQNNGKMIDEVLVMLMRGPKTYTGEDTVEINCHGGTFVVKKVLETVIQNGARPAMPGEFAKRAFLNGKMDLSQAEAVMDVIHSENEYALQSSISQLKGSVKKRIESIRSKIIYNTAFIETALDDPENVSLDGYADTLYGVVNDLIIEIKQLVDSSDNGKIIKEGIQTVIVGKPNAGKSSLLNLLVGKDRAIVTEIEGTTRDVLEEQIQLGSLSLNLIDTAGIRNTEDRVEKIGVNKAKEYVKQADLIIYVVDASRDLDQNDKDIIDFISGKKVIILLNKTDLKMKITKEILQSKLNNSTFLDNKEGNLAFSNIEIPIIDISAKEEIGMDQFENVVQEMFLSGQISFNEEVFITNMRHKTALYESLESLKNVLESIKNQMPEDFYSIDLMDAYESLGSITGETIGEDLVNEIFSKFCMGK